jgi:patatin-like phospholipase/acyl hydrolase
LDGGGSRGVMSVVLLRELEKRVPGFLQRIDLFAGTSIGAANAVALAQGHTPAAMVEFYNRHGRELFHARMRPRGWLRLFVRVLERIPGVGSFVDDVDSLFLPKWTIHGLEAQIREFFGATPCLRDVPKTVLLPALKLDGKGEGDEGSGLTAVCMHNFEGSPYDDTPLHSALLRSMAAPLYFASHEGYVDGGLFAANPCIAALAAAVATDKGNRELSSIRMLSIGAGICPDGIPHKGRLAWGLLKWGPRIMDASINGVAEFDCDQARALLSERFCRLNVVLPRTFALDDYREIPTLEKLAEEAVATPAFDEAARFVERNFGAAT